MKLTLDGREYDVEVEEGAVVVNGERYQVAVKGHGLTRSVTVNGRAMRVDLSEPGEDGGRTANVDGKIWQVRSTNVGSIARPPSRAGNGAAPPSAAPRAARAARGAVTAQMTGRVLRVAVKRGDRVEEGALLLVLEAMKMENEIRSPRAGTVKAVPAAEGSRVNAGDVLVELQE